ncbi:MAG: hypothetical protein OXN17_15450 [Candidatus Poribacteria bacterium]|nr:hypothetical protein [Candidatus Poribacteria bacterium]
MHLIFDVCTPYLYVYCFLLPDYEMQLPLAAVPFCSNMSILIAGDEWIYPGPGIGNDGDQELIEEMLGVSETQRIRAFRAVAIPVISTMAYRVQLLVHLQAEGPDSVCVVEQKRRIDISYGLFAPMEC